MAAEGATGGFLALGPFGYLYFTGIVGVAILMVCAHWRDLFASALPAAAPADPRDGDRHVLTLLGPDGRPNPARYELHDDYPSALARQRDLATRGQGSVVRHAETGATRVDLDILETYRRIAF